MYAFVILVAKFRAIFISTMNTIYVVAHLNTFLVYKTNEIRKRREYLTTGKCETSKHKQTRNLCRSD